MKIKKILPFLCAPLLLCGCDTGKLFGQTAPQFDTAYTIDADISYGDHNAAAQITRYGKDEWEFSFTEPSVLMGMKLSLSEDGMTAKLGDLNVSAENSTLYQLIPDIIASCIDILPEIAAENIAENDGILTLTGEIGGSKVVVTTDKNGDLLTLKCPKHKLMVEFKDQVPIDITETTETFETLELVIIE